MSESNIKEGLSAIAKEVLQDVQKEAESIMREAEVQAKETLRLAKDTADQSYKTIIDEAIAQTQAEKRRIDSVTEVEARNQLLQTKEALVEEAFKKALGKLQKLAETDGYHEYLIHLVEEASKKINEKSLIVRLNASDKAWITNEKLIKISEKLHIKLEIAKKPEKCIGGCIVQTPKGDVTYDQTLEAQLEQLKPDLRSKASKIIFAEAKEDAS